MEQALRDTTAYVPVSLRPSLHGFSCLVHRRLPATVRGIDQPGPRPNTEVVDTQLQRVSQTHVQELTSLDRVR